MKDNKDYKKLYNLKKEEYVQLFEEMLKFINYQYKNKEFYYLSSLIQCNYPYYSDVLIHLENIMSSSEESYCSLLKSMEKIYNKISKSYKNHEENMKKYEEEKNQYEFGYMDDDEF